MYWVEQGWYISLSFISLIHCRWHCPNNHRCNMKELPDQTVQLNLILGWNTLLWGSPLPPVNSIYTLFSEVHLNQMVPLHSQQQQDIDMHDCQRPRDCELQRVGQRCLTDLTNHSKCLRFSLKTSLSITLTTREFNMCVYVCDCLHQYISNKSAF